MRETAIRKRHSISQKFAILRQRDEKSVRCLRWPISELESELHVGSGEFIVLGAEPSVGKTAFALQCAWPWAASRKVGFFSFETDPKTLFDRLISGFTGISMESIKTNRISRKGFLLRGDAGILYAFTPHAAAISVMGFMGVDWAISMSVLNSMMLFLRSLCRGVLYQTKKDALQCVVRPDGRQKHLYSHAVLRKSVSYTDDIRFNNIIHYFLSFVNKIWI